MNYQRGLAACEISLVEILRLPEFKLPGRTAFVYFLMKGRRIVYIGQTFDLLNRLQCHWTEKAGLFDSVRVMRVNPRDRLIIEAELIRRFRPKLNDPKRNPRRRKKDVERERELRKSFALNALPFPAKTDVSKLGRHRSLFQKLSPPAAGGGA